MSLAVATVGLLFLLTPGFAFIAGVNLIDKNIREIVFRGTPAEIAYVVAISLVVHIVSSWFALVLGHFFEWKLEFNIDQSTIDIWGLSRFFTYILITALLCLSVGLRLGWLVRQQRVWTILEWRNFVWRISFPKLFVKHRWMLPLVNVAEKGSVRAYVILAREIESHVAEENRAILIKGWIRDVFFAADGSLLYIVLAQAKQSTIAFSALPSTPAQLRPEDLRESAGSPNAGGGSTSDVTFGSGNDEDAPLDLMVVEGPRVEMIYYEELPLSAAETPEAEAIIAKGAADLASSRDAP